MEMEVEISKVIQIMPASGWWIRYENENEEDTIVVKVPFFALKEDGSVATYDVDGNTPDCFSFEACDNGKLFYDLKREVE